MSQVIKIHPMEDFKQRSRDVLNDPGQRKNFRGAMDFLQAKRRGLGKARQQGPTLHLTIQHPP